MLCYVISGVLDCIIFHNIPFWEDECIRILPCGTLAASAAARKVSGYSDGLTLCRLERGVSVQKSLNLFVSLSPQRVVQEDVDHALVQITRQPHIFVPNLGRQTSKSISSDASTSLSRHYHVRVLPVVAKGESALCMTAVVFIMIECFSPMSPKRFLSNSLWFCLLVAPVPDFKGVTFIARLKQPTSDCDPMLTLCLVWFGNVAG